MELVPDEVVRNPFCEELDRLWELPDPFYVLSFPPLFVDPAVLVPPELGT